MPKTKAAKNIKPGDWVTFGRMAFLVGDVEVANGEAHLFIGYDWTTLPEEKRVTMHYGG